VVKELRSCAGKQFDPEMVEAFLFDLPAVQAVRERYPDSE
jgi:response regulator RpfG family c-di-GMP phosphodiesterase